MPDRPENPSCVTLNCGWGRLIFAHTFPDPESVAREILNEAEGQRDIAFYLNDPHLVLNQAPQEIFLDPSITFRLEFDAYKPSGRELPGFRVAGLESRDELAEVNRIYNSLKMVPVDEAYVWEHRNSDRFRYFVARANDTGEVLGVVLGVDHMANFNDLMNGSSLWALAVDKQAQLPGIGEALVRQVIEYHRDRGRERLDLSVMHDNQNAIRLYEKLGFRKVAVFAVKCRNPINERLFVPKPPDPEFNPYATIIIDEAMRRGIHVHSTDPGRGFFTLTLGGRSITCRESLSEMTTAIALLRCDDKSLTREILHRAGLRVPAQREAGTEEENAAFLAEHGRIVVKPAQGEQGQAVAVDLTTAGQVEAAVAAAREVCDKVILESFAVGQDLRVIVINREVVAAAVRRPPEVVGTGRHSIRDLVERLSRRRSAATGGESHIPVDAETRRCVESEGFTLESILPEGRSIHVRKTANLHTGGTIHDVTADLNPELARAAVEAATALDIPVVGFDFIVPEVDAEDYVIIEANERPGLANHEPQPTAQRFIDLLFPATVKKETETTT